MTTTGNILATDDKNVASRVRLAANHNNIGAALLNLGDLSGAAKEYAQAASLVEPANSSVPPTEQALYAHADSYTGMA